MRNVCSGDVQQSNTLSSQLCFYVSSENAHKIWEHRIVNAMKLSNEDPYADLYAQFGVAEVAVKA